MKKIIYMVVSLMLIFTSCQQGDEELSNQDALSQEQQLEQQFRNVEPSTQEAVFSDFSKKTAKALQCQDCDAKFKYLATSGSTAHITITGPNGNVFDSDVTTGVDYTFPINSCDLYNITTQALTGSTYGNLKVYDEGGINIIPVQTSQQTYQQYSFSCPPDVPVDECTITICLDNYQGSANAEYILVYVNGSYVGYHVVTNDGCFDLVINDNDTLELKLYASGATSDYAAFIRISTPRYNMSIPMRGYWSSTGIINSKYLQCSNFLE